jgi:hypothetical protein
MPEREPKQDLKRLEDNNLTVLNVLEKDLQVSPEGWDRELQDFEEAIQCQKKFQEALKILKEYNSKNPEFVREQINVLEISLKEHLNLINKYRQGKYRQEKEVIAESKRKMRTVEEGLEMLVNNILPNSIFFHRALLE